MRTNKHVRLPIKMGKLLSLWVAMVLVIILSLSAVVIVWQKSINEVSTIDTQPTSQYFWRDSNNKNTRISLQSIQESLLDSRLSLRNTDDSDEFELEMWQALTQLQSRYNSDMWRDVYTSSVSDFINYQTEEIKGISQEYKDGIRDSLKVQNELSALDFLDTFIFGDVSNLDFSNISEAFTHFTNEGLSSRLVYIPTIPGWAMAVLEGAYDAAVWIVRAAGWWVPTIITVGLVLVALAVMTAVIIAYWSEIKDFFSTLVNDFISSMGKVADAVRDFFNNILNQAKAAYMIRINQVEYIADTQVTASTIRQYQSSGIYYLLLLKDQNFFIYPYSVSRTVATNALILDGRNNNNIGTYTLNPEDAAIVAQDASPYNLAYGPENHAEGAGSLYFWHYHPGTSNLVNGYNAHSWYGNPV